MNAHTGFATFLRHVKFQLRGLHARHMGQWAVGQCIALHRELTHLAARAVLKRSVVVGLPCGLELVDLTLRLGTRQEVAHLFGQRHTLADLHQSIQIQTVCTERARFKCVAAPAQTHHTTRPVFTLLGVEHQILAADFHFTVLPLCTHATMHMTQTQGQQICPQASGHSI